MSVGFPTGQVIALPLKILLEPTDFAISVTAQICATGMPALSISLPIVAPQRVLVPHVEVSIAACTPLSSRRAAISSPILLDAETDAQFPVAT